MAVGFPLAFVAIGVAQGYATGDSLPVTSLLECLYFIAAVVTVIMCAGTLLVLLNRLFPPKPVELPDDDLSSESSRPVRKIVPPKPYRVRLARFLGVAPSELENRRSPTESNMKFWTSLTAIIRHGPKPPALIRFFLERIRRAVRGEESAQRPR